MPKQSETMSVCGCCERLVPRSEDDGDDGLTTCPTCHQENAIYLHPLVHAILGGQAKHCIVCKEWFDTAGDESLVVCVGCDDARQGG